jgi:hypothetical protein
MQGVAVVLDGQHERWRVSNEAIECVVRIAEGRLRWDLLEQPSGRHVAGSSECAGLALDGQTFAWSTSVDAQDIARDDGSHELRIATLAADGSARLVRSFEVFPGVPFVRISGGLEYHGDASLMVTGSEILNLEVHSPSPLTLFHVEQFSWVYRRDFFSQNQVHLVPGRAAEEIRMGSFPSHFVGPTSCAWFALRDGQADRAGREPNHGAGFVAGIEFNGKSRLRAWATLGTTHLVSTIDELRHIVVPGEQFEIPAFFVGSFSGDWDEAGYVTQRFAERYVYPPMPDERYPWVQYNSWRYEQDINEAQQLEAIERCAALGVEVVVMDLGWAVQIGEWRHNPEKFPDGLRPLAERARAHGMRFGVHIALAQASVNAPVAREHPDWLTHEGEDYFGAAPLCLGHDPCREWLIGEIVRLIDDEQIDYFVQDGEDMVKACGKSTHTHAAGDSNYANSVQGIDQVIATVRRMRPHIVWENCEDGGCMMTYRMARLCHSSITVDNIATYATRQGIYGASYPFSPRYSVRYMQDDPTSYTLRSAIFGGPLILMQKVTEWNADQMAETRAAIEQYKQIRALVRDARIIHLLPPRYNVEGIGWGWDAIQAVSPDRSRSVIMVYRALGDTEHRTIYPRGLDAARTYRIRLEDRGDSLDMTGEALRSIGLALTLPELASEMIQVEALDTVTRSTATIGDKGDAIERTE